MRCRERKLYQYKITYYPYREYHCGDKTILRQSYLNNGISNSGKMAALYSGPRLTCPNFEVFHSKAITSRPIYFSPCLQWSIVISYSIVIIYLWNIFHPSCADTRIFREKSVNTLTADVVAPCIARLSAAIMLSMPLTCTMGMTVALINSMRPSDAYMRHQTKPSLFPKIVCGLFHSKPLSEPMLVYF